MRETSMKLIAYLAAIIFCATACADVIYDVAPDGTLYGRTDSFEGLIVAPDGTRYVYPDRRIFLSYSEDYICVQWNDRHEECVPRFETDCIRGVNNFDIDPFIIALFAGEPDPCGGRFYFMSDVDSFVATLVH